MIELCKINRLKVVRDTPQGLYLEEDRAPEDADAVEVSSQPSAARFTGKREDVLLPRPEVPDGVNVGDELDVFIYLDSADRYTATLKMPRIFLGGMAVLKVVQVTDIGVFLDWGLAKNLLLPFREVVRPCFYDPVSAGAVRDRQVPGGRERAALSPEEAAWFHEGRELPVVLYIDKTGRPAATMRVYDRLTAGGDYVKDSAVEAVVVQINPDMGVFVAVDDRYYGMINIKEIVKPVNVGDRIFGRISGVRDDGKYMISLTQKAHLQMDNDAQTVLKKVKEAGGVLKLGDKSDAKDIMRELGMSKKAFKRAVGQLYKEGKVTPGEFEVRL